MASINVLDKKVSELIAAGEVIERPSSVVKELLENSIDAASKNITLEINGGGISYIRITDDGSGISHEDVPVAFLRHATSKVRIENDLESITTMGFRGEALASISAVAKIEFLTKKTNSEHGTIYKIDGGEETEYRKTGCPDGTTIIIRSLFFNTPARLKFLKKDVSEGNSVQLIAEKLAISHPEISFRFIRDNKVIFSTTGNSKYIDAIYSVFGKQFATSLIPIDFEQSGVSINGYISSPLFCKGNRAMQFFFVNSRYIKSPICIAALEEGYRTSVMIGKFPACVLNINVNPSDTDVNVHPTKTEVRFANEKIIFDAMYFAVKNAILNNTNIKEITINKKLPDITPPPPEIKQMQFSSNFKEYTEKPQSVIRNIIDATPKITKYESKMEIPEALSESGFKYINAQNTMAKSKESEKARQNPETEVKPEETVTNLRVIGELWKTYIVCEESGENKSLILIDKHAAHERIRYEILKDEFVSSSQLLAEAVYVDLDIENCETLMEHSELLLDMGIELINGNNNNIEVLSVPSALSSLSVEEIVFEIIEVLKKSINSPKEALFGELLHSVACKSAMKANDKSDITDLIELASYVYNNKNIRFCPHGRPIMTRISKYEIEKNFGRV